MWLTVEVARLEHNPLTGELGSKSAELAALRRRRDVVSADLVWHKGFEAAQADAAAAQQSQELAELEERL